MKNLAQSNYSSALETVKNLKAKYGNSWNAIHPESAARMVTQNRFNTGLDRNINFLEFAKSFSNNTPEIIDTINALEEENTRLMEMGYNDQTMSALLDLDMNCRRLFANVYGGSDLKYNSKFDKK